MYRIILVLLLYHFDGNPVHSMECNSFHKRDYATINAYSYNNSSRMSRCTYQIKTTTPNRWIKLSWKRFSVDGGKMPECSDDSVVVYTGCGGVNKVTGRYSKERKVATFCSKNMKSLPHDIYSPANCIKIVFTNYGYKSRGFIASYQSYPMTQGARFPTQCSIWTRTYTDRSGVVGSPSWPARYQDKQCAWKFRTGDTGKRYVFNIMDMNMYNSGGSCSTGMFSDNVYIKGEKSLTTKTKQSWVYCNYDSFDDNEVNTEYYELYVQMRIRRDRTGYRGFVIGYLAYEDEIARALTSWGSVVGGLIVAFIATIFVFCCYRRWRRRQMTEQRPLVTNHPAVVATAVPPPGSYPMQPGPYPTGPQGPYPTGPQGPYPTQPGSYPVMQPSYPPPVYADKPPEYQPPPYEPPTGGPVPPYTQQQYPPPGQGGYPGYPPQPPAAYPTAYPPP